MQTVRLTRAAGHAARLPLDDAVEDVVAARPPVVHPSRPVVNLSRVMEVSAQLRRRACARALPARLVAVPVHLDALAVKLELRDVTASEQMKHTVSVACVHALLLLARSGMVSTHFLLCILFATASIVYSWFASCGRCISPSCAQHTRRLRNPWLHIARAARTTTSWRFTRSFG